jgi:hypothetical protein
MTRYTEKVLDEVRAKLAASDLVLQAARDRRGLVLDAAMGFEFALRPYNSGSIAHWTASSDLDADCGVVLNRRKYQALGPDGDSIGPNEVVEQVADLVRSALPGSNVDTSKKRAITVEFGQRRGRGPGRRPDRRARPAREARTVDPQHLATEVGSVASRRAHGSVPRPADAGASRLGQGGASREGLEHLLGVRQAGAVQLQPRDARMDADGEGHVSSPGPRRGLRVRRPIPGE